MSLRVLLGQNRQIVNADLVKENFYTAWVKLSNGDCIKRKKIRDFIDFVKDKFSEPVLMTVETNTEIKIKQAGFWNRLRNIIRIVWRSLVH
jgi:hypothetical protein